MDLRTLFIVVFSLFPSCLISITTSFSNFFSLVPKLKDKSTSIVNLSASLLLTRVILLKLLYKDGSNNKLLMLLFVINSLDSKVKSVSKSLICFLILLVTPRLFFFLISKKHISETKYFLILILYLFSFPL